MRFEPEQPSKKELKRRIKELEEEVKELQQALKSVEMWWSRMHVNYPIKLRERVQDALEELK